MPEFALLKLQVEVHFRIFPEEPWEAPAEGGVPKADILEFNNGVREFENATVEAVPCSHSAFEQMSRAVLQEILKPVFPIVDIILPKLEGSLDWSEVHCLAFSQVLCLDLVLEAWPVCPCHGEPLQAEESPTAAKSNGSNDRLGTLSSRVLGIADCLCPVTSAPLRQDDCRRAPLPQCPKDPTWNCPQIQGLCWIRCMTFFSEKHAELILQLCMLHATGETEK